MPVYRSKWKILELILEFVVLLFQQTLEEGLADLPQHPHSPNKDVNMLCHVAYQVEVPCMSTE